MTRSSVIAKSITLILAALMLWHYGGVGLYAQTRTTQGQPEASSGQTAPKGIEDNRFDALLSELKEVLRDDGAKTKAAPAKGFAGIERVNTIRDKLAVEDEKNQQYFAQLGRTIAEKKLPAEIRERHAEFVGEYQSKYDALMAHLDGLQSAHKTATGLWGKLTGQSQSVNWGQVIEKATAFLDANTPQPRPRQRFDPHNLPHRSLKAEQPIAPKLTREEWLKAFPKEVAPSGPTSGPTSGPRASEKTRDTFSALATAPPAPADLAETIEVKFTPEIRQLADSLDRNPVKIYNWARNNIEFVPTWGSIQGAQLCLENRAGNAFDTASLLMALLRYSGIPARYQMGTIEVPIEKTKNWLGGFTDAYAAARFAAAGGTPSVTINTRAGNIVGLRLEHIWVKSFVDFSPSRGSINLVADSWVEMDPSFKLYAHSDALDPQPIVQFDAQQFLSQLQNSATVDPQTGSATNLDAALITGTAESLRTQLATFINTNMPQTPVREIRGARITVIDASPVLSGTLPYRVISRGPEASAVPSSLQHHLTFVLLRGDSEIAPLDLNFSATGAGAEENHLGILSGCRG